jgi:hypothetical protein
MTALWDWLRQRGSQTFRFVNRDCHAWTLKRSGVAMTERTKSLRS